MDTVYYNFSLMDGTPLGYAHLPVSLHKDDHIEHDGKSYVVKFAKLRGHPSDRKLINQGYAVLIPVEPDPKNPLDYLSLKMSEVIELLAQFPIREAREKFERAYLWNQAARFGGNISKTAEFIGMERSALMRKLVQLRVGHYGDVKFEKRRESIITMRATAGE
jgi:DNA-binding NtrC family response regulator